MRGRVRSEVEQRDVGRVALGQRQNRRDFYARVTGKRRRSGLNGDGYVVNAHS
jgi:hypothetical protein